MGALLMYALIIAISITAFVYFYYQDWKAAKRTKQQKQG